MRLAGFNFNKIIAEKTKEISGEMKISTKIDFLSIEPIKPGLLKIKDELIKVGFSYTVSYDPNFAKIELTGDILLAIEPKIAKDILREWKEKKTSEEFRISVFNLVLKKSNIKALQLEEELILPFHIPLPFLDKESFKEKK
ncbi:Uncharacterised protein [uncultured archaeon]|nr:Uncharacterised protein [uncultured archaeon]